MRSLWILASSPQMVRILCTLPKLDLLLFDLEHSAFAFSTLTSFIEIVRSHKKQSCLRLPSDHSEQILHGIELNPDFLMIPGVSTSSQVSQIIDSFSLPPLGSRGFSPYTYPSLMLSHNQSNQTKLCLQLESKTAMSDLSIFKGHQIVHSIFIGRYDLAISCGFKIKSSIYVSLLCDLANELRSYGLNVGTVCLSDSEYEVLSSHFDFLSLGSDVTRMLESKREFIF